MAMSDAVLARLLVDDQSKIGFMSFQRNAERSRKVAAAFRENAIDQIVEGLDKQVRALRLSAKELDLYNAKTQGATQAQLDNILSVHEDIAALKAQKAQQELVAQEQQDAARKTQELNNVIAQKIHKLREEAFLTGKTEDQVERYKLQQMGATKAQIDAVMAQRMLTRSQVQHTKAQMDMNRGLRLMRGGLGQLGHQVQDVAVQLQMGQNALLVFGQQGSQVASLFGQRGALIGAVLAVGAALGTYLAPKLFETRDRLKELEDIARSVAAVMSLDMVKGTGSLTDEIVQLGVVAEDLAKRKLQDALEQSILAVTVAQEEFNEKIAQFDARSAYQKLIGDTKALMPQIGSLKREFGISAEAAKALAAEAVNVANGVEGSIPRFDALLRSTEQVSGATTVQKENLAELKKAFTDLLVAQDLNERQKNALIELEQRFTQAVEEGTEAAKEAKRVQEEYNKALLGKVHSLTEELALLEQGEEAALRLRLANEGLAQSDIDLIVHLQNKINALKKANEESEESAKIDKKLADDKEAFANRVREQAASIGKTALEMLKARAAVLGLSQELKSAFEALDAQAAAQSRQKSIGDIESLKQSLMSEEQALFDSYVKRNQIVAEALANDAIAEEAAYALQLQLLTDFENKKKELKKKSDKFMDKSRQEQVGMVLGDLGTMFSGVQAQNRKMFAIQKAFNIAQAIMSTYTGATKAIETYPPPLSYAMAAAQVAAGMAHVANIRAQSFAGGGFTGMGSRSGGMDGKGGFPAILHPNETVIDHTKGQGQGITIVTNVDARGSGPDVEMKIRKAVEQGNKQTVAIIRDLAGRGRLV